jgi:hypothetical protein
MAFLADALTVGLVLSNAQRQRCAGTMQAKNDDLDRRDREEGYREDEY